MMDYREKRKRVMAPLLEAKWKGDKESSVFDREPLTQNMEMQTGQTMELLPLHDLMQNLEPPRWLITNILPEKGLVEIFGASGSFKSFIVMDMGYCIATGTEWHGHTVAKGNVVYFAGEGYHGLRWRGTALERHYGKLPDGFYVSNQPLDMSDEATMLEAGEKLKAVGNVKLVIIDTLHRNFGEADEDSARDWGKILKLINKYLVPNADVIIWVHHTGHAEAKRSRGTSSRYASLDTSYLVERDKTTMKVRLECTKMKDAPEPDPLFFEMETVETGHFYEDTQMPITSLVPKRTEETIDRKKTVKLTRRQKDVLAALRLAIKEKGRELPRGVKEREGIFEGRGCTLEEWREEAFKVIDAESYDAKRMAFKRAKNDLQKANKSVFFDGWCYVINDCRRKSEPNKGERK